MKNSLIIAAVLFLTYDLFLEYGPKPVQAKMQSQWQENRYALEKYLRDSKAGITKHEVVYVGSSLTTRLDFDDESKCVYNLSFNGDSALTGLSAIANSAEKPRLVFIEINVPERGIDQDLIAKTSGFLPQLSAAFYIENMPINLAISFLHSLKMDRSANEASEVNEPVRLKALAMMAQGYKGTMPSDILKNNMTEFSRLVRDIESSGTKVIFYEMPIYPDLENSTRAVQIRNAFINTFPNNQMINFHELTKGSPIKTVDGMHLLKDEAKNVVRNMEVYSNSVCANPNGLHPLQ
ncbi:MAG: hypothetical protein WCA63_04545 [Gallionella sp.]